MISRKHILAEIKRTAAENGGRPLGIERFSAETGIGRRAWHGRYWTKWTDAQIEAGFEPNTLTTKFDDNEALAQLAAETRRLGHFPTIGERMMRHNTDPGFPGEGPFLRMGKQARLAERLAVFCGETPGQYDDVMSILAPLIAPADEDEPQMGQASARPDGSVYLMRSGRRFKIGHSNDVVRRRGEVARALQTPDPTEVVHVIQTDDPTGIEQYWHRRFASRLIAGTNEFFTLTREDVVAFKRRKFQ